MQSVIKYNKDQHFIAIIFCLILLIKKIKRLKTEEIQFYCLKLLKC